MVPVLWEMVWQLVLIHHVLVIWVMNLDAKGFLVVAVAVAVEYYDHHLFAAPLRMRQKIDRFHLHFLLYGPMNPTKRNDQLSWLYDWSIDPLTVFCCLWNVLMSMTMLRIDQLEVVVIHGD